MSRRVAVTSRLERRHSGPTVVVADVQCVCLC